MTQRQNISIMKNKSCQYLFSPTAPTGIVIPKSNVSFYKGMTKEQIVRENKQVYVIIPTGETREGKDGEYYFDGKGWCYVDGGTIRKYPIGIMNITTIRIKRPASILKGYEWKRENSTTGRAG